MHFVHSQDGTQIAYDKSGQGPALILVAGAFSYRQFPGQVELAKRLSPHFTVYNYDRRGRGDSGNRQQPYAIEREIEDLAALIQAAGGSACRDDQVFYDERDGRARFRRDDDAADAGRLGSAHGGCAHAAVRCGAAGGLNTGKSLPAHQWRGVGMPTVVLEGPESPIALRRGTQAAAKALPNARLVTKKGLGHTKKLNAEAIAQELIAFFAGEPVGV
ncbi:hypothetical protein ABE504_20795 [Paenibacillus oryzisoli]|uniref:alpha/beta fold hydrolase n=1 Tax=Paenibacillus oryzisoli TaxID=1850517 RepID=UPI003D2DD4E3